jgi:hypothetical protein
MKLRKLGTAALLAALIMVSQMPPAAAGILDSASQMVNLVGTSGASGIIPLTSFQRVMPDGTLTSFAIASNRVLLITKIVFRLSAGQTASSALFQIAPFYYVGAGAFTVNATSVSGDIDIESGLPLGVWSDSFNAQVSISGNGQAIPGTLVCRMVGILAPRDALIVPIYELLLSDN